MVWVAGAGAAAVQAARALISARVGMNFIVGRRK